MFRSMAAMATVAALALGAACGNDSSKSSASNPHPVAQIDALSGRNAEATLDQVFVKGARHAEAHARAPGRWQDH